MPILGIWASQNYPRVTNSYESISTVTVGSGGVASVTFSSIPSGYTHLQIRGIGRSAGTSNGLWIQLNGDTTNTNYNSHYLYGSGSGVGTSTSAIPFINYWPESGNAAGPGMVVIDILDYRSTNKTKTVKSLGGFDVNGTGYAWIGSVLWNVTPVAITSVTLLMASSNTMAQDSSFALYGIKAA